jgi:pimeloyl-ACP methyl ester carboxylesterase
MPYSVNQGVNIHYEVEGHGPPLVMMHGFSGNLEVWYDYGYVQELGKNYQLILMDARGHGASDKPHEIEAYRPNLFAGDIVAVLDDLGVKKAHYYGYSQGGAIGFKSVARHALSRFYSLILGGMSPYNVITEAELQWGKLLTSAMQTAVEQGMESYISIIEKTMGPMLPSVKAQCLKNDPSALLAMRKAYADWPGSSDILSLITTPCLIFVGEADAYFIKAKEGAEHMPYATFVSFPGLNHVECSRRSDLIIPHVRQFLAKVSKNSEV